MEDIEQTKEYQQAVQDLSADFRTIFSGPSKNVLDCMCLTDIDRPLVNNMISKSLASIRESSNDLENMKIQGLVMFSLGLLLAQQGRAHVGAVN